MQCRCWSPRSTSGHRSAAGSSANDTIAMATSPPAFSTSAAAPGSPPHGSSPSVMRMTVTGPFARATSSITSDKESANAVCDSNLGAIAVTARAAEPRSSGANGTSRRVSQEDGATCLNALSEKACPPPASLPPSATGPVAPRRCAAHRWVTGCPSSQRRRR